jgi:hypothetical protein
MQLAQDRVQLWALVVEMLALQMLLSESVPNLRMS